MSIQAVISAAQSSILSAVSKIQNAPEYAATAQIRVPTSLAYADNIRMMLDGTVKVTLFDLKIDILVPVGTGESSMVFISTLPQAIGDVFRGSPTISGTAATYAGDVTALFVRQPVGGVDCVGWAMTVEQVKLVGE